MADRLPHPYRAEAPLIAQRLALLAKSPGRLDWSQAAALARPWVKAVRDNPPPFWAMESLLQEYPISSAEGLALMRLAEALLRVPDAETAIAFTADQLGRADFDGHGDAMLSRLSSSAIALSKKFLPEQGADAQPGLVTRLGARTVVAATVRAVQLLGRQFVLGQSIASAMEEADRSRAQQPGLRFSYDMLGEGARTDADALRYLASYRNAIQEIAKNPMNMALVEQNDGISIKLSALHPRYEHGQHARVMTELLPRVWELCTLAANANINLTIDAEEVERLELSLDLFEALLQQVAAHYPQWQGFGLALQAYQTRAQELVEHVIALARRYQLRLMCRLVKGAYWDSEIKRAQELGLAHYPVFTHKQHTDASYLACARAMLAAPDAVYPQFATHNAGTIAAILQMAGLAQADASSAPFELQRLHGMGDGVYREVLARHAVACRVYAPVGAHRDLLAYLVRRLLENGANSSFVHQLADPAVDLDLLLISPLHAQSADALVLPPGIYGAQRRNSAGLDLAVAAMAEPLFAAHAALALPSVAMTPPEQAPAALARSAQAFDAWNQRPVEQRASMLLAAADALEQQLPRFATILVKEAFKTWGDAIGEVREAVDFLRYYAQQAQTLLQPLTLPSDDPALGLTGESNRLRLLGRGPWVCISPWNFPLAIFLGQIAAALVTGNSVLAKPAEQTPVVAFEAVKLLHAAGVPEDVLICLHGPGETLGAALVALPGVAGVVFTGSTQVARLINRALAAKDGPIVPLIAETGGLNAMLVDSSALPEQVVDAVVQSAFRSAGQRCSALRLLCVHEAIADHVISMLQGAAQELRCGDPSALSTDLGPVIDAEAHAAILGQLQRLRREARALLPEPPAAPASWPQLLAPQMFEIERIADLKQEIFGPVLHIVRWGSGALQQPAAVIAQVNQLGYGLTLGLQTRIDSRAQTLAAQARIGNVYVNRNTIGAVVGLQPFGGQGLSGTGPKAGGPHYLARFCTEQTVTINTTAAGGNVKLMASLNA